MADLVDDCYKNGLKLVIKIHPRDELERYHRFSSKCQLNASGGDTAQNFELIRRSKLVVTKHSTVSILALLAKKPIAFINYRNVLPFLNENIDFPESMILKNKKGTLKISLLQSQMNPKQ